jgi:predicted TIM-barrel fold metal-dependent hydrolase
LYVPELLSLMEKRDSAARSYRKGPDQFVVVGKWVCKVLPKHTDPDAKLADMDAARIQTTAISINNPGPELFGADGLKAARIAHDFLAELSRAKPSRFFGLAVLPLQDMQASLLQLSRCVDKLGFRGILLYSNLDGK